MLGLGLLALAGCAEPRQELGNGPEVVAAWPGEAALVDFYAKHYPGTDPDLLRLIAKDARDACEELCLSGEADTLLAMLHVESSMTPGVLGDDGRSEGLGQTLRSKKKALRRFWKARGVELGVFEDPTTQVYFAAAELKEMLGYSRGDLKEAVRRYNGSGWMARRHAERVMRARRNIFNRPYEPGEWADPSMRCQDEP